MKYIKWLLVGSLLASALGCQKKEVNYYVIYNLNEEYITTCEENNTPLLSPFRSPFALPVTQDQKNSLDSRGIERIPYYVINTIIENHLIDDYFELQEMQFYINGKKDETYKLSFIELFPYFEEFKKSDIIKEYVGEIDNEKEYIYISEAMAQFMVVKDAPIDIDNGVFPEMFIEHLEDKFTEAYTIKAMLTIPVEPLSGETYEISNYVEYGPFEARDHEQILIEKEFVIKGVIRDKVDYFSPGSNLAYIENESIQNIYSYTNMDPEMWIVISDTKKVEQTFEELGIEYSRLNEQIKLTLSDILS